MSEPSSSLMHVNGIEPVDTTNVVVSAAATPGNNDASSNNGEAPTTTSTTGITDTGTTTTTTSPMSEWNDKENDEDEDCDQEDANKLKKPENSVLCDIEKGESEDANLLADTEDADDCGDGEINNAYVYR